MTINFYTNNSSEKAVNKVLTSNLSLTGTLREECDVVNPSVLIEHSGFITSNYAYIPEFGRYYYIRKKTSVRNNLWRIDFHVDVRSSFKEDIKRNKALLERSEYLYNLYLPDSCMPIEQDNFNITYDLGAEFTHANVLALWADSQGMTTGGGGGSSF